MKKLLEKVSLSGTALLSPMSPDEAYASIVDEAIKITSADFGAILWIEDNQAIQLYATSELLRKTLQNKQDQLLKGISRVKKATVLRSDSVKKHSPELFSKGAQTAVLIPLVYANQPQGLLILVFKRKLKTSASILRYLDLYSAMASAAIRKTHLYDEARNALAARDRQKTIGATLEQIHKSGLRFLEPLTPEETYERIVKEAMKLVKADIGSIFLAEGDDLKRVYASDPILFQNQIRKRGHTYEAYKSGKPLVLNHEQLSAVHPKFTKKSGIKSTIFIPLDYKRKSLGVLSVDSTKTRSFTEEELNVLKLFGSFATMAIIKTQLYLETSEALRTRDLFISMAAHELRTPLTVIKTYSHLLQRKLSSTQTPEAKWAGEMEAETQRLAELVNELLDMKSIQSGQLEHKFQAISLRVIVERAVSDSRIVYPEHNIQWVDKLPSGAKLKGDPNRLLQVFTNIINNAGKFSKPGKPIIITTTADREDFKIAIKDRGPGIRKKDLDKIFQGFYKGEKNNKEGMGLGLYIADDIVRQHGGKIAVESQVGKGTTFTITIPRKAQQ